jgi:glutamyl-tRNA reductase
MGAGETGTLVAEAMAALPESDFHANRTYERARRLAEELAVKQLCLTSSKCLLARTLCSAALLRRITFN